MQWNVDGDEVHSQKIRVVYLPPEGQTVPEEDETHANMSSLLAVPGQDVSTTPRHRPRPPPHPLRDPFIELRDGSPISADEWACNAGAQSGRRECDPYPASPGGAS